MSILFVLLCHVSVFHVPSTMYCSTKGQQPNNKPQEHRQTRREATRERKAGRFRAGVHEVYRIHVARMDEKLIGFIVVQ